jgi:malonate transporter MadL subunit
VIYGVALLSGCMFVGSFIGNILGLLTGVNSDVGGVGFAMLLLLIVTNSKKVNSWLPEDYKKSIDFLSKIFIPVIIAMSMSQNVVAALSQGWLAIAAGLGVVLVAFMFVPILNKLAPNKADKEDAEQ